MIPIAIDVPRLGTMRRVLPASWKEVPQARRLPLWQSLLSAPGEQGRVAALRLLLDLPDRLWQHLRPDHVAALLDALPWLDTGPSPLIRFDSFRHGGRTYYLPDDHGLNMVAIEYPIADEAFEAYLKTHDVSNLRLLCGVLCREVEVEPAAIERRGDRRIPLLSRAQAEARALRFADLDDAVMAGVLLFFAGLKMYVHGSYGKVLFEQEEQEEGQEPRQAGPSLGWWSLYWTVATDGPYGRDVETVYQTSFHDVCLWLVDRIRAQKQLAIQAAMARSGFAQPE